MAVNVTFEIACEFYDSISAFCHSCVEDVIGSIIIRSYDNHLSSYAIP